MIRPLQLNRFMFFLVFILVFAMASRTPLDSDMWWHIRAGKEMVQHHTILTRDFFSYTRFGEEWINHSWLSQIVLFLTFDQGKYLGLALFTSILAALSMITVYPQMSGHPLIRGMTIVVTCLITALVWSPRPQMFTLLFFGLTSLILYKFKKRDNHILWVLPIVFIFWSNLHGGYILGLFLMVATILGEVLDYTLLPNDTERLPWKSVCQMFLVLVICWLIVAINPNGWRMWLIPFQTFNMDVLQKSISEWASPNFHQIEQQPFLWILVSTLALVGLSGKRLDGVEAVKLSLFTYLALYARRNFAPFALVVAPILASHLDALMKHWRCQVEGTIYGSNFDKTFRTIGRLNLIQPRIAKILNIGILTIVTSISILKVYWVTRPDFVLGYERMLFPAKAVEWIKFNQPHGNIFNSYNWGGYLDWYLPEYPVFVDGRTDLYDDQVLNEYLEVAHGDQGWNQILDKYRVNFVLIESESLLNKTLTASKSWELVYQDDLAVIYVRASPP